MSSLCLLLVSALVAIVTAKNVTSGGPNCDLDGYCQNCAWCISNGGKFCQSYLGNPWCWGRNSPPQCDSRFQPTTNCDIYDDCSNPLPAKGCRISDCKVCTDKDGYDGYWCASLNGWPGCSPNPSVQCDPGTPPAVSEPTVCCGVQVTSGGLACNTCVGCTAMYGRYCQTWLGKRWCLPLTAQKCDSGSPDPTTQCDALCCGGSIPTPGGCTCSSCQGCQLLNGNYCQAGANGTAMCMPRPTSSRCPTGDFPRGECGCTANTKVACARSISNCGQTACRPGATAAECQQCMAGYYTMCCPCLRELGRSFNCN